MWFWGSLAYPELYCDWPVHSQHSWNCSGVHGFLSLTVTYRTEIMKLKYYTFCSSLRENTHSFGWNGDQQREDTFIWAKKRTFEHKSDSITILHFNQHSITFLGIHLRHSTYKGEKYAFINANIRVINIILKIIWDNRRTFKCKRHSLTFL